MALSRRHLGIGVGLPAMWALMHLGAWAQGDTNGAYVSALSFSMVTVLIVAYYALLDQRIGDDAPSTETTSS